MNVQDIFRYKLLLCLIFCAGSGSAVAQEGAAVDRPSALTLEQLKTEGSQVALSATSRACVRGCGELVKR